MITLDLENREKKGLCEYLVDSLKKAILEDKFKTNEKLPSKRAFAIHLGVSVITIQNAYNRLIEEGYIYSIEKKGFFVSEIIPIQKKFESRIQNIQPINQNTQNTFFSDFQSNSILPEKFPFNLWAKVSRQVLNSKKESLLNRQDIFGIKELRLAIAKHLLEFRNMNISYNQILIGGTETIYSMLVQFLGRNKRYALENPGYKKIASIFKLEGANCKFIPIDNEGMNPYFLKNIDIVHISPLHHFPTGIVTPINRRNQLINWTQEKRGRFIIEDDYDSEFRFNGKPLLTLQSRDNNSKVIYINTFSKTLAPSFRISYMVLPQNLVDAFKKKFKFSSCQVNAFEQFTLAKFINDGYYSKHIIRMKNYYRTIRNELISAIQKSKLHKISTIHEENSGLHFLLSIKTKIPAELLEKKLLKEQIRLPLLKNYYHNNKNETFSLHNKFDNVTFVLNYSGIKKERITQTIKKMETAILSKL